MPRRSTPTKELRETGLSTEEVRLVRARSPYFWLRPVLLAAGLLAIGGVVLLLAAYRFGRTDAGDERGETRVGAPGERVLTGHGFDFTQTSGGTPVFRIRAAESQQDRDGTSYLTTVDLDVFREDGRTYRITSESARFHEGSRDARLEGNVVLSGWDQLELEARALELRHQGQVLTSSGAVEFRYPPDLVGRASQLQVDRRTDMITLSGGVHLHSVEGAERPMRLDCQRLVYQRAGGILRAVGDVSLTSDRHSLAAHHVTIFLAEDGRSLEALRARWNVVGKAAVADDLGGDTEIEYRGQFLDVQPDDADPGSRRVKLDGEGETVTLAVTDLTGLRRVFSGLYLVGHARGDRLVQIEGVGEPVVLRELLALKEPFPLRQLCAERITARFLPDGAVSRVQLENRVELNDRGVSLAGGESASLNAEDGTFRIQGPQVLLSSRRGEVTAEQFVWTRETDVIRARSGVRAVLAERSVRALRGTPLAQGEGPVQVEADEAYWTTTPPSFTFEGHVRAWRGESLLLADQLRGDEREQTLAAAGGVRTVWVPAAGTPSREPIEVSAERVSYHEEGSLLIYDEKVEMRQGQRTLNCRQLAIELSAGGSAERMVCQDDVRMADPENGNRVQGGERAVYTLADDLVEIFGDEVELFDGDNRLRGRYVRCDLRAGTVSISSRPAEGVGATSP